MEYRFFFIFSLQRRGVESLCSFQRQRRWNMLIHFHSHALIYQYLLNIFKCGMFYGMSSPVDKITTSDRVSKASQEKRARWIELPLSPKFKMFPISVQWFNTILIKQLKVFRITYGHNYCCMVHSGMNEPLITLSWSWGLDLKWVEEERASPQTPQETNQMYRLLEF